MKKRPYPVELSLVCTWLLIIPLYAFSAYVSSAFHSQLLTYLYWLFRLFAPIDANAAFLFFGGVLVILGPAARTPLWGGLFLFTVPNF
jgi:hypothetical protein